MLCIVQVVIVGVVFVLFVVCGGGDDNNSSVLNMLLLGVKMQIVLFGDSLFDVGIYLQIKFGFGGGCFMINLGQVWMQNVVQYYGDMLQFVNQGGFGILLQVIGGFGYVQGGLCVMLQLGIGYVDVSVLNFDYVQVMIMLIVDQVKQYLL